MKKLKETIKFVEKKAKENFVPIVRDKTLEALLEKCRELDAKHVLEIGTATGYSGLNMLLIDGLYLTTIEKNCQRFEEARDNFVLAGVESRVNQILGDADEVLQQLLQSGNLFDLVFLDGPKGQYIKYLPYITKLLRHGGVLFADNTMLGGLIKNDSKVNHKNRTMTRNMKAFLNEVACSKDFETEIYEIEDGFTISKKK